MWNFSGVYGPVLNGYKEDLWEELGAIRGLWEGPWCVVGDFNMIRFPFERKRRGRTSSSMRRFFDVIEELWLRDISLQGGPFTWRGGRNNGSMSRLDRFLFSGDWEEYFSNVVQTNWPRPTSDHSLILLDVGGINRGPFPFRFENMWLKVEGFKELLKFRRQSLSFKV